MTWIGLVELHCASFRPENSFITAFGKDFVKSTYLWQVNCKDIYILVGKINGKIAGMISVCDGPYSLKMLKGCFMQLVASLIKNPRPCSPRQLCQGYFGEIVTGAISLDDFPSLLQ